MVEGFKRRLSGMKTLSPTRIPAGSSADTLEAAKERDFMRHITCKLHIYSGEGERVVFSGAVKKYNKFSWAQERNVIITQVKFYNFSKKSRLYNLFAELKRIIQIRSLRGITKSLHEKSFEFVVHVKDEHDYRIKSET
jgi:hypothetical protein